MKQKLRLIFLKLLGRKCKIIVALLFVLVLALIFPSWFPRAKVWSQNVPVQVLPVAAAQKAENLSVSSAKSYAAGTIEEKTTNNIAWASSSTGLRYITVAMEAGRLGNKLFQYASMYGCAKRYNFIPIIRSDSLSQHVEKSHIRAVMVPDVEWKSIKWRSWRESRASSYNKAELETGLQGNDNVLLESFLQSYRYFEGYEAEVVSQFVFSQAVRDWAAAFMRNVTARVPRDADNSTIVGIHIRRGDYLHEGAKKQGYNTPGAEYYVKAVRYFTTRYAFVAFVVCSTDFLWVTELIERNIYNDTSYNKSTVFVHSAGSEDLPERDLALLSLTKHSILSAGSYSFWAAMMRQFRLATSDNGTTVYYKKPFIAGTAIAETYGNSVETYYPPGWIGLE